MNSAKAFADQPTARMLRVSDTIEYYGRIVDSNEGSATILAEGLDTPELDDLFVVSYEKQGRWQAFIGKVFMDSGLVETTDGLILRSVVLHPAARVQTAL